MNLIIKTYSAHTEGKSVVIERLTRTLKNKVYDFNIQN